jgi:hypothetical protein
LEVSVKFFLLLKREEHVVGISSGEWCVRRYWGQQDKSSRITEKKNGKDPGTATAFIQSPCYRFSITEFWGPVTLQKKTLQNPKNTFGKKHMSPFVSTILLSKLAKFLTHNHKYSSYV